MGVVAKQMFETTSGAETIGQIDIELPASWRGTECTAHINTTEGRENEADVLVTGDHPIFGSAPRAVQYGGCGVKGLRMELPFLVLTNAPEMSSASVESTLEHVMRWRYGVFEEAGIVGDPMYPANYTDGIHSLPNVGCTKDQVGLPSNAFYALRLTVFIDGNVL